MSDYFHEKLELESQVMPQVIEWLQSEYGFQLVADVRLCAEFQQQDIDLLMEDATFGQFTVEVKIRAQYYDDIAFETQSSTELGTDGCLKKSRAFFLAYVYVIDGKLHKRRYLLHLPSLKEWFQRNKHRYKPRYAPNPPDNPIYHTEFYPIPIRDIPTSLFLFKGGE